MSKGSREKHAKPAFEPVRDEVPDEDLCVECGFFEKLDRRDVCEHCAAMVGPETTA